MELSSLLYEKYIVRNNEWIAVAERLAETKKMIKYHEKIEQELSNKLKELSDDMPSRGGGYIYHSIKYKGSIDYLAVPAIQEMFLEEYRKPSRLVWKLEREL